LLFLKQYFVNEIKTPAGPEIKIVDEKKAGEEIKAVSIEAFEREKMENILAVVSKWEREEAW